MENVVRPGMRSYRPKRKRVRVKGRNFAQPGNPDLVLEAQAANLLDEQGVRERVMRPLERVHIFGAAGCGSSTLGRALAQQLESQYVDTDDIYWLPTVPPYQIRRSIIERLRLLQDALQWTQRWVLSGSLVGWGDALSPSFDLVIFLYVPVEVRLRRLRKRESERFGDAIEPTGSMYEQHQAFLRWAAGYEAGMSGGRTLQIDANWLATLKCPVIPMTGECPTLDQVSQILSLWAHSHH
jgi:adenylate kinase family enzyme